MPMASGALTFEWGIETLRCVLLLPLVRAVGGRIGVRRTEEQLAAVGKGHIAAAGAQERMIARPIAVHYPLGPHPQTISSVASPQPRIWAAAFHHPDFLAAVRL